MPTNCWSRHSERMARKSCSNRSCRRKKPASSNLDTLQKADPEQLVKFVEGEHPQTVALVLAHLGARTSTSLLVLLPEKLRAEAVRRLAVMQQFSTEMVKRISVVLHKKLASTGRAEPPRLRRRERGRRDAQPC